jgi:type II secretion system protein G
MNVLKIKKNLGFTLIELLVVITILGLLSTVGLGSFRSSQIKGRDAQRKHDLGQIQKALEMYFNDYGKYPSTGELPAGGVEWEDAQGTLYMKSVPGDPRGGSYCYESSDGTYYKLYAKLENENDPKIIDLPDSSACNDSNYGVSSTNTEP